ncbi:MAG: hypothetical protein ACKV0T_07860 [Planctomycetales bacterium]
MTGRLRISNTRCAPFLAAIVALAFCGDALRSSGLVQADENPKTPRAAEADEKGDALDAKKDRSLDILIAEHVILWDGEIVTWEEVIDGLRAMRRDQGKPIHPNFKFTNAAIAAEKMQKYQQAAFQVYKELFEPAGMSIGSVSPRAGPRYDAIRTPEDLLPNPKELREGIVRTASGRPVSIATVLLFPEEAILPVMLKPDLSLRDPLDEVWVRTDREGRFRIACPDSGYRLAVLSPVGFAIAPIPKVGEPVEIELLPRARLDLRSTDGSQQTTPITVHLTDLPNTSPGFGMYEVTVAEIPVLIPLPPGRVTISRAFDLGMGAQRVVPAERFELLPGQTRKVLLEPGDPDAEAP